MAASPSPAVGLWGGARSGEKTGGGAGSVGRSGHPAAGKLGDKEGSGEGKAKFGVASAAVVSESAPARTDAAPAAPGMPFPSQSRAGRKQLLSPSSPGQGRPREGLSVEEHEGRSGRRRPAARALGGLGSGLPCPASLTARPFASPPLTLSPVPLGYLPLSASAPPTNSGPLSHSPRSRT